MKAKLHDFTEFASAGTKQLNREWENYELIGGSRRDVLRCTVDRKIHKSGFEFQKYCTKSEESCYTNFSFKKKILSLMFRKHSGKPASLWSSKWEAAGGRGGGGGGGRGWQCAARGWNFRVRSQKSARRSAQEQMQAFGLSDPRQEAAGIGHWGGGGGVAEDQSLSPLLIEGAWGDISGQASLGPRSPNRLSV